MHYFVKVLPDGNKSLIFIRYFVALPILAQPASLLLPTIFTNANMSALLIFLSDGKKILTLIHNSPSKIFNNINM